MRQTQIGSAETAGADEQKAWLLVDWFVRDLAPLWVAHIGMDYAALLTELPEVRSSADVPSARRRIRVVKDLVDGVAHAFDSSEADRNMATEVVLSVIGDLATFADAVAKWGSNESGELARDALTLAGASGREFLLAGIRSAPPAFSADASLLRRALRQAVQPTVDVTNLTMAALGQRLQAAK